MGPLSPAPRQPRKRWERKNRRSKIASMRASSGPLSALNAIRGIKFRLAGQAARRLRARATSGIEVIEQNAFRGEWLAIVRRSQCSSRMALLKSPNRRDSAGRRALRKQLPPYLGMPRPPPAQTNRNQTIDSAPYPKAHPNRRAQGRPPLIPEHSLSCENQSDARFVQFQGEFGAQYYPRPRAGIGGSRMS